MDIQEYIKQIEYRSCAQSYIIGFVHSALREISTTALDYGVRQRRLNDLISFMDNKIADVYYKDDIDGQAKAER